jgi:hypothetical protein
MLEKLMANLGALRANKHAEALMNAVSRRFSETPDVNITSACFLVTPIGKTYYSAVSLRRCSDDQSLPGLLGQSAPVPLSEGFMHKLASADFHYRPATRH